MNGIVIAILAIVAFLGWLGLYNYPICIQHQTDQKPDCYDRIWRSWLTQTERVLHRFDRHWRKIRAVRHQFTTYLPDRHGTSRQRLYWLLIAIVVLTTLLQVVIFNLYVVGPYQLTLVVLNDFLELLLGGESD